jgi:hypothetical protein
MTFIQLLARYDLGAIADHEFAVESLNQLDPRDPAAVLERLPVEILPRVREFIDEYRPGEMIASHGGLIPTPSQIQAARSWLDSVRERGAARVGSD